MQADQVWDVLRGVIDPELGINIVDLGLVYDVQVANGDVRVAMTMTTPACPLHTFLIGNSEALIWQQIPDAHSVDIRLVWSPPWNPQMMTEDAKRQLGWETTQ